MSAVPLQTVRSAQATDTLQFTALAVALDLLNPLSSATCTQLSEIQIIIEPGTSSLPALTLLSTVPADRLPAAPTSIISMIAIRTQEVLSTSVSLPMTSSHRTSPPATQTTFLTTTSTSFEEAIATAEPSPRLLPSSYTTQESPAGMSFAAGLRLGLGLGIPSGLCLVGLMLFLCWRCRWRKNKASLRKGQVMHNVPRSLTGDTFASLAMVPDIVAKSGEAKVHRSSSASVVTRWSHILHPLRISTALGVTRDKMPSTASWRIARNRLAAMSDRGDDSGRKTVYGLSSSSHRESLEAMPHEKFSNSWEYFDGSASANVTQGTHHGDFTVQGLSGFVEIRDDAVEDDRGKEQKEKATSILGTYQHDSASASASSPSSQRSAAADVPAGFDMRAVSGGYEACVTEHTDCPEQVFLGQNEAERSQPLKVEQHHSDLAHSLAPSMSTYSVSLSSASVRRHRLSSRRRQPDAATSCNGNKARMSPHKIGVCYDRESGRYLSTLLGIAELDSDLYLRPASSKPPTEYRFCLEDIVTPSVRGSGVVLRPDRYNPGVKTAIGSRWKHNTVAQAASSTVSALVQIPVQLETPPLQSMTIGDFESLSDNRSNIHIPSVRDSGWTDVSLSDISVSESSGIVLGDGQTMPPPQRQESRTGGFF